VIVALLPLACWVGLEQPFSTPKLWLAVALAASTAACTFARRTAHDAPRPAAWPWLAWVAAVSVSAIVAPYVSFPAVLLALAPIPAAWALRQGRFPADSVAAALVAGSALLAGVVGLQFCGTDPFTWIGWRPEIYPSTRMRLYGTMGNPAFVAAWLVGALPLTIAVAAKRHPAVWLIVALEAGALAATGSRAGALGIAVAAVVYTLLAQPRQKRWLAGLALAAAVVWLSPARPLGTAVEGRLYLTRIAAAHWREVPITGYGPGALEARFAPWQAEWLKTRGTSSGRARFAATVDHLHNDYLEFFVEYGPAGLAAFLVLNLWLAEAFRRARRSSVPLAAWAGAAALAAVACVDFPFHRPAEWCLYWLLVGIAGVPGTPAAGDQLRKLST
jgi:O-antigen ligase